MSRERRVSPAAVWIALVLALRLATVASAGAAADPTPADARRALLQAVRFFHKEVARHGGYVWRYSADLAHGQGEGPAGPDRIWIQPPGTPAVGLAFLDAWAATGEPDCLDAARDAARARDAIAAMDERGAWTEPGTVRGADGRKVAPPGGIIASATFIRRVRPLAAYVRRVEEGDE
ncbi:MAG: hypothetical protein R6X20_13600 [Phycisphaerae bacterium]